MQSTVRRGALRYLEHAPITYLLIAFGGLAGATARWAVGETVGGTGFPWATLVVNVIGCGLLAAVLRIDIEEHVRVALAAGFCGGLTTFSTFAVEVVELLDGDDLAQAAGYLAASVGFGLAAYVAVHRLMSRSGISS